MTPTITAFAQSPDRGRGLARDMRVRWALEEVGQPYEVRLVTFAEMKEAAHRARHPFGQIPTYEEGDLVLFESGAIVLHIAERHASLLPNDAKARARDIPACPPMSPAAKRDPPTSGRSLRNWPCSPSRHPSGDDVSSRVASVGDALDGCRSSASPLRLMHG